MRRLHSFKTWLVHYHRREKEANFGHKKKTTLGPAKVKYLVLWIIQQTGWHHSAQKCMSTSISLSLILSNMNFFCPIIILSSAERDHYYNNRLRAEKDPQKFLSVIIDGMDQAKTNIPHVTSMSKASSNVSWKTNMPVSHNFLRMKYGCVYVPDGAVPLP